MINTLDEYGHPYNRTMPYQLVPMEYQGWVFFAFMVIMFVLILYLFYMIATDPRLEDT